MSDRRERRDSIGSSNCNDISKGSDSIGSSDTSDNSNGMTVGTVM